MLLLAGKPHREVQIASEPKSPAGWVSVYTFPASPPGATDGDRWETGEVPSQKPGVDPDMDSTGGLRNIYLQKITVLYSEQFLSFDVLVSFNTLQFIF